MLYPKFGLSMAHSSGKNGDAASYGQNPSHGSSLQEEAGSYQNLDYSIFFLTTHPQKDGKEHNHCDGAAELQPDEDSHIKDSYKKVSSFGEVTPSTLMFQRHFELLQSHTM